MAISLSMRNIYEYKPTKAEFKDLDLKKGVATGYFSAFNNVDSYGDIMMPTAFNKSISETGPQSANPRIKHLLNHDTYTPVGKLDVLQPDTYGLYYESVPGTHAAGQDFIKMAESGLITENSIGFTTIKSQENSDGTRVLQEVKLYEGSSLTFLGVNSHARFIGMKSEDAIQQAAKRLEKLEKFCRNSTATDETIESLLLEVKQLNQLIFDIQNTTKPLHVSTQPEQKNVDWQFIATQLLKS